MTLCVEHAASTMTQGPGSRVLAGRSSYTTRSPGAFLDRLSDLIGSGRVRDIELLLSECEFIADAVDIDDKNELLRSAVELGLTDVAELLILMLGCDPTFHNNWAIVCFRVLI